MPYVLRRNIDDRYIAPATSHSCYTNKLDDAQLYVTRAKAEAAKCDDEYIQELSASALSNTQRPA